MSPSKFNVVIVGGSVAGLTLGNILQRLGIDFVILEAYKDITPQVGASIGLQANGLRVLDQIGLADELTGMVDMPLMNAYIRDSDGSVIMAQEAIIPAIAERYGYRIPSSIVLAR